MKPNTKRISFLILLLVLFEAPLFSKESENRIVYFEDSMEESETQKQKKENSIRKETKSVSKIQFSVKQKNEADFPSDENFAKPEILRLEEEWNRYSPENIKQYAIKLRTLGAIKQKFRDYKTAIRFYEQSLKIQDRLGEREDKEYALTLYLKSIAQFRIGQTCQAVISVRTVIEIYRLLGDIDSVVTAEDSLKKYSGFCAEK